MLFQAKDGICQLREGQMEYVRFGTGKRILIMIPGLGDGLRSVKGTALPVAWMYRVFAREFTVYMFSRKKQITPGSTTREMARELVEAMERLRIPKADVLGVSMGGMIAQWLAIDYPEKVGKLILAVTSACPNPVLVESVEAWMALARKGDHTALMKSNLEKIYSPAYCRQNGWMVPVLGLVTKPGSYERFLRQAEACLTHDALGSLTEINAPTLVIGGEKDEALSPDASRLIAERIPDCALKMYAQWGHGLYEEAKDFNRVVLDFLEQ